MIIITRLSQYGIKFDIVEDSNAYYVLKSIVYTGKDMVYSSNTNMEDKTTIQVVKSICETFSGTYRTIYIDWLYTLIDLLREICDMLIFAMSTGTNNCTT